MTVGSLANHMLTPLSRLQHTATPSMPVAAGRLVDRFDLAEAQSCRITPSDCIAKRILPATETTR
jgi:hypothetical protein